VSGVYLNIKQEISSVFNIATQNSQSEVYLIRSLIICVSSSNIISAIKSWRVECVGHVAHMGERDTYILVGRPEGKRPWMT
jgi:hypothetical protein